MSRGHGRWSVPAWRVLPVALLLAVGTAPARAQNPDADHVLGRAIAAFQRVNTLRANFTQSVRDPMLGSDDTARGELLQQRPNKFAMRFTDPRGDLLLIDGTNLWVYLPSSAPNQVVRSAVSSRPGQSPDVMREFLETPQDRFTIAYVRSESIGGRPADALSFTPRQANSAYRRVVLWIDRQDDLPHQIEISEASGAVRRITLDRLRVNTALPASAFTFTPPAGVRVVDASR